MKHPLLTLLILTLLSSCTNKPTELVLMGTVHQPVENFNPDSLYQILEKIDPDLILFEVDSSFFTPDFQFIKTWESNENIATIRYMNNYEVDLRPYDYTGRNEHRINIGARPTDSKALALLDSLYQNQLLLPKEQATYEKFLTLTDSLSSFAYHGAKAFNNAHTDSVAAIRQHYQYEKLLEIISNHSLFSSTYHTKEDGDSISYAAGYEQATQFWHKRNQAMAKHILHFVDLYKGKRIVVLNGYFHRYYLNSLLTPKQEAHEFIIKDFDEY